jgi:allophanate hydrolase
VEVWEVPAHHLGGFIAGIPAPLGVGRITLEDGSDVLGFLCEASATENAVDISEFGDWRRYLDSVAA